MKIWRLKKGADRRFRQGHPWVFTSELAHSSREVQPGEVVELRDQANHFLAFGYAHPSSQICFRRLSSRAQDTDVFSPAFFTERLTRARQLRQRAGWSSVSHRWLYAEADGVPGLVVDAFRLEGGDSTKSPFEWAVVVQASTAGVERVLPALYEALLDFQSELGEMIVVEAPSSRGRLLEGLTIKEKTVVRPIGANLQALNLQNLQIVLQENLMLQADLLFGQKTGFFLDQQWNALILRKLLAPRFSLIASPIRVLDICSYVGQWSAHCAHALSRVNAQVEVTLVDQSEQALKLAEGNLQRLGSRVHSLVGDALTLVGEVEPGSYDVVICDPPAFVKKRADLSAGVTAYTKLMRDAMRATKPNGLMVASSCSGLVGPAEWQDLLHQASAKAGRGFKIMAQGGHGPDHPVRPEFPEGRYLKCDIGEISIPF